MGLSTRDIEQAAERYWREYDRYTKLSQLVGEICRDLVKENVIRASVHWRAKSRDSFTRKLQNKHRNELDSVDAVFERVGDLAAVRVMTYVEDDRERAVELIKDAFSGPSGHEDVEADVKDSKGSFYRATHCQVRVPEDKLVGVYENLRGLSCEV